MIIGDFRGINKSEIKRAEAEEIGTEFVDLSDMRGD